MALQRTRPPLADRPSARRYARLVHRLRIARDQRMPPRQTLAFTHPAIRAGWRQPVDLLQTLRRQADAIGHPKLPARVVAAPARLEVQQPASHVGKRQRVGILMPQLVQAAAPAAVAQGLPLVPAHLLQRLRLPERLHSAGPYSARSPEGRVPGPAPAELCAVGPWRVRAAPGAQPFYRGGGPRFCSCTGPSPPCGGGGGGGG